MLVSMMFYRIQSMASGGQCRCISHHSEDKRLAFQCSIGNISGQVLSKLGSARGNATFAKLSAVHSR
jgi:hypothetical protein